MREEVKAENNREIISNLLKKRFSSDVISEIVSLPISEIEKIIKELE